LLRWPLQPPINYPKHNEKDRRRGGLSLYPSLLYPYLWERIQGSKAKVPASPVRSNPYFLKPNGPLERELRKMMQASRSTHLRALGLLKPMIALKLDPRKIGQESSGCLIVRKCAGREWWQRMNCGLPNETRTKSSLPALNTGKTVTKLLEMRGRKGMTTILIHEEDG
jgi:hypothetical protein